MSYLHYTYDIYIWQVFTWHWYDILQVAEGLKYLVRASYLEIYNEEIRDLLGKDAKARLELKEHPDKGVYVKGQIIINTMMMMRWWLWSWL